MCSVGFLTSRRVSIVHIGGSRAVSSPFLWSLVVCGSVGDLNTHSGTSSRWRDAHNAFFVARGVPLLSGCQWDVAVESGVNPAQRVALVRRLLALPLI